MLDGFCQVLSVQLGEFATLKHWFVVLKWCGCLSVKSKGSNRTSGCTGSMNSDDMARAKRISF